MHVPSQLQASDVMLVLVRVFTPWKLASATHRACLYSREWFPGTALPAPTTEVRTQGPAMMTALFWWRQTTVMVYNITEALFLKERVHISNYRREQPFYIS